MYKGRPKGGVMRRVRNETGLGETTQLKTASNTANMVI